MNGPYKHYMVFAYDQYYPSGGLSDCEASFDDLEAAKTYAEQNKSKWRYVKIFDRFAGEEVK